LEVRSFDLVVEEHPRYTFHFQAALPQRGRLVIHDTNYISSEGTSRLGVRGREGVEVEGDDLPPEVTEIPIRPVWQLGDEEERRTRQAEVVFQQPALAAQSPSSGTEKPSLPEKVADVYLEPRAASSEAAGPAGRLVRLLDRDARLSSLGLLLIAFALGAAHSIQPGHGKTLVSAVALGPGARWYQPVLLGLVTTLAHTGSVLLIAAGLWYTGASRVAGLHQDLTHLAGFAIAAGGLWRVGRSLGGIGDHHEAERMAPQSPTLGGLISLGVAGGLVPCWDAVGLVVLSAALGRLVTGILLVVAFGLGMALVLVSVGLLASRLKSAFLRKTRNARWENRLSLASGVLLATIGLVFFLA
jgi:ABC-type nickel/cobalt efflux system permease component RcnA